MTEKYILLGATGYIGQAFQVELENRNREYVCYSREQADYTRFDRLSHLLRTERPSFLINCAGFTGKPNVDACEQMQADTILGNVTLPQTIADACEMARVPWGHVSSGCIYSGAKLRLSGQPEKTERDLLNPSVRKLWQADPSILHGFTEQDAPNFSFRDPPCSFYSGTKALGEETLHGRDGVYLWRLRIPFDHLDSPRNYLSKIQSYSRVYDNVNSLSHRGDFAKACLDLWEMRAPFGTYNVTNPGWVTTRQVASRLIKHLKLKRVFDYFENDDDFYRSAVAPRSNTVLDCSKLIRTGVEIRGVDEALDDAIQKWQGTAIRPQCLEAHIP